MPWPSQELLTAIFQHAPQECVTEARMAELTGFTARKVDSSARMLRKHGLLEKTAQGCHKLTPAGIAAMRAGEAMIRSGQKAGNQTGKRVWRDTLRTKAWAAMRIRRKFSVPELITLVAEEGQDDITNNLQKYVRALTKAGYLVELPRREPGAALTSNGYKRYWLQDALDTGPKAPVWRVRAGAVYDPNTEQEVAI